MMMPAVAVLFVCKMALSPVQDVNAKWTGHETFDWTYENSMMHCRREEVSLIDGQVVTPHVTVSMTRDKGTQSAYLPPADEVPFTTKRCQRDAWLQATHWDETHKNTNYRVWRVACPTAIVDQGPDGKPGTPDDRVIGWKPPECPTSHRDTVVCEGDFSI